MPILSITTSFLTAAGGALACAIALTYLAHTMKGVRGYRHWAGAYWLTALRYGCLALLPAGDGGAGLFAALALQMIAAGFLLRGTLLFLDRPAPARVFLAAAGATAAWAAVYAFAQPHMAWMALLAPALSGVAFLVSARLFLGRWMRQRGYGFGFLSAAFALAGLHELFTPFVSAVAWAVPWATIVALALAILIALGLVMTALRQQVRHAEALQQDLAATEQNFHDLIDAMPQGILILRDKKSLYANQAFLDIFGFSSVEEFMHTTFFDGCMPADEKARLSDYHVRRMAGEDLPTAYEFNGLRQDGKIIRVSIQAMRVEWNGERAIQSAFQDVTEQHLAQARQQESERAASKARTLLADSIDSLSEGFALFDEQDKLVIYNHRFRETLGIDRIKAGDTFEEILRAGIAAGDIPAAIGHEEQWIARRMAQHRAPEAVIERHMKSGLWLHISECRTRDGGVVSVYTDITELKNRESELVRAREEAVIANRSKSEFLANMSHELRTPLNSVIGFSDLMIAETMGAVANQRYREYIGDINTSGKHLLSVINDLLDVSRIEADAMVLHDEQVDIAEAVDTCLRMVSERAYTSGVEMVNRLGAGLPLLIGERRRLRQILLNLLTNAIKFTPEGGTVVVSTAPARDGGLEVTVADTGIGIDPGDMETVLKPFGQAERGLARNYDGTGLGLFLSNALVRMHGGTLTLASTPGEGTTVTVTFPAERLQQPGQN